MEILIIQLFNVYKKEANLEKKNVNIILKEYTIFPSCSNYKIRIWGSISVLSPKKWIGIYSNPVKTDSCAVVITILVYQMCSKI